MLFIFLLLGLILVVTFIYFLGRSNESYWKKRGVKFHKRNKVLGPFWDFVANSRAFYQIFKEIYLQYPDEPAVGFGTLFTPSLYVKDKTNVQYVMSSPLFSDRGFDYNDGDRLADNLLFMAGTRWKLMRQKMTPLFTASKIKSMFYIMDKTSQDFVKYLHHNPELMKTKTFDTMTIFSCAVISASVFGVDSDQSNFYSPFLEAARGSFHPTFWKNVKFSIAHLSPRLFKTLDLKFFREYEDYFFKSMKQVFRLRGHETDTKHDFAEACLSIQKKGAIVHEESGYKMDPTDELLAAQGFFFFAAGAEPLATAIFGFLITVGERPEVQRKVLKEIDDAFSKNDGKLSCDAIGEMGYLEKVLCESLRMYPPIGYLTRRCIEDTVLPVGNIKIEKGTKCFTPIYEFHSDPQFFKDPEVFDPERFSEESKQSMGITFMPFGYGPRKCIGYRYALLQVKCALVYLLRNFDLKTHINGGGIKYGADQVQLRMKNVDVEFIPRKV